MQYANSREIINCSSRSVLLLSSLVKKFTFVIFFSLHSTEQSNRMSICECLAYSHEFEFVNCEKWSQKALYIFLDLGNILLYTEWCESHGPGSFALGRKYPEFVLQYLWNEAINHIAVFSLNNVILRGIRYNIQRCNWLFHFRDIEVQILDHCVLVHKILDRFTPIRIVIS